MTAITASFLLLGLGKYTALHVILVFYKLSLDKN